MAGQDTVMKALTRSLSDGALDVLGVRGVELESPLPTELPANTLRIDKAWRMRDGCVFHLEFQSYREPTLHRFLEYDARLARQHMARIRTVVLYHASVTSASATLDIGTALYQVENVFLSNLDGDKALDQVEGHVWSGEWEPGDRLRLALALNMKVRDAAEAFERVLTLVPALSDEAERDLVVSAILVLGAPSLTDVQRARLRRELRRVSKIVEELYQEGREEGREEVARNLLAEGVSVDVIVKATGLSRAKVEELGKQLQ
ncbi:MULTISPECIES: hypothetical protein [Alicyclobacillus]|uniref:hypothetical protein n=1 Tax=Alicyclobacillus TaxID=29330 RepID=UPI0008350A14|nr:MULTISPECIES: hypothetical protein [Alicyclobacillus]MCL6626413.1 hypothetical protein [Alicyclobacillus shizuokensis]